MSRTKVLAFLLSIAGLAGLLFAGLMASAPFLVSKDLAASPPLLAGAGSGCLAFMLFAVGAPLFSAPGLIGLGLWFFVVRKQDGTVEKELTKMPERELEFQVRLDGITRRLIEHGTDATNVDLEIPGWTSGLDPRRQRRLICFLSECGFNVPGSWAEPLVAKPSESGSGWVRALALGLFAFAALCLLWSALTALTHLTTDPLRPMKIESGPNEAIFGSLGCMIPGLTAALGGLGLRWMLRRSAGRQRRGQGFQDRARQVTLDGCLRRIERLLGRRAEDAQPVNEAAARITRAQLICSLSELDGAWKGRLIGRLHAEGFLSRLAPGGLDLQGAVLAGMDLSAAALAETNLAGAFLGNARLVRADLHGSRLQAADLSCAEASGSNLRRADLRGAKLHRCNLRQADLSFAELQGANLWQADLTGADLAGARVTTEQLAAACSLAGATLPSGIENP
jgi:uncharacterized protein YjbI with pentapeptide repeats